MSAYRYMTVDGIVTASPCRLLSVLVTTDGGGPGKVELYDEQGAEGSRKFATLLCSANQAKMFSWTGLELQRGLYVDIVEKADYITVEWEPLE